MNGGMRATGQQGKSTVCLVTHGPRILGGTVVPGLNASLKILLGYLPLGKQGIMETMLINTQRMPLRVNFD